MRNRALIVALAVAGIAFAVLTIVLGFGRSAAPGWTGVELHLLPGPGPVPALRTGNGIEVRGQCARSVCRFDTGPGVFSVAVCAGHPEYPASSVLLRPPSPDDSHAGDLVESIVVLPGSHTIVYEPNDNMGVVCA